MNGSKNRLRKPHLNKLLFLWVLVSQWLPFQGWAFPGPLRIQFENQKLSAEIKGASLLDVLKELQRVTGVKFTYKNLPQLKIDQQFDELSLENGIKRILPVNTIFLHSGPPGSMDPAQNQKISSVIVLPFLKPGTGPGLSSPPQPATQKSEMSSLNDSEALPFEHTRYQKGVDALLHQIEDSVSAYNLLALLKDERPENRLDAVNGLGNLGTDFAVKALYMALGDHNAEVKEAAAAKLKQISERKSFQSIERDLGETNAIIQNQALDRIDQKSGKQWENLLKEKLKSNQFKGSLKPKAESLLKSLMAKNRTL